MRVAALYDIHGNLPALEAVMQDVYQSNADLIVIGGDVVPGPMPGETIEYLRKLDIPIQFISGNGEREVLAWRDGTESTVIPQNYRDTMRWVARQIDPSNAEFLKSWPQTLLMNIDGLGDVLFCHATPRSDTEVFTRLTSEKRLVPVFEGFRAQVVVCGHTHMQFERTVGSTHIINAGSVGMPFGEPGAYWLLLGPGIQLQHTSYNLDEAAARIRATSYPQAEEFAELNILKPPSEKEMVEAFSKIDLG